MSHGNPSCTPEECRDRLARPGRIFRPDSKPVHDRPVEAGDVLSGDHIGTEYASRCTICRNLLSHGSGAIRTAAATASGTATTERNLLMGSSPPGSPATGSGPLFHTRRLYPVHSSGFATLQNTPGNAIRPVVPASRDAILIFSRLMITCFGLLVYGFTSFVSCQPAWWLWRKVVRYCSPVTRDSPITWRRTGRGGIKPGLSASDRPPSCPPAAAQEGLCT